MTTKKKLLIGAVVAVVLVGVVAVSLNSKDEETGTEVYMGEAVRKDMVSSVSATGRIEPRTKVEVQSSVIGEIVKLPVKDGDRVRRGDLLVQLDPELYQSDVDRLQANLRMTHIEIEREDASLANLRNTLRRHQDLAKQGILSEDVLEKSQLDVRTAEIALKSLREQVSQAVSTLTKAKDELRKTTIVSPMDGVVTQLNAELGEMTMTGTMNNPGTVIMVVSDLGAILAEVDVDETRVVQVKPGQNAQVIVDAVGELHPYDGHVVEIAGTAVQRPGQEVQVFPVKIALEEPDEKLRPGMTAKARIETQRTAGAVTVPIQAVLLKPASEVAKILADRGSAGKDEQAKQDEKDKKKTRDAEPGDSQAAVQPASATPPETEKGPAATDEDGPQMQEVVFKVVDKKAVLVPVKTGMSDESDIAILDGLKEKETLVTGPYRAMKKLEDGEAVKKKEEAKGGDGDEEGADAQKSESGVEVEVD